MALTRKPTPYYRPILKSALHHVFVERDVWLFGVFAIVLSSGSAIETVLRTRNGLEQIDQPLLNQLFPFLETLRQWFGQFAALSPVRITLTLLVAGLILATLLYIAALSQGAVISGAKKHRKTLRSKDLVLRTRPHVWKILGINLLLKITILVSVLILLTPLLIETPVISETLLLLQGLVGYGLILVSTLIAIYAMAAIINHKRSFQDGLREAWSTFQAHPGSSLEMALLLFFINFLVGLFALLGLLLISVPYTTFFLLGALGGSMLATTLSTTITFFVVTAFLVVLGGATVAYNYTVIALLYQKLRRGHIKSKWYRVLQTRHWF